MSAKTKVSALDHAMQTAHTWINDVAREFDTEDGSWPTRAWGVAAAPCAIDSPCRRAPRLRGPVARPDQGHRRRGPGNPSAVPVDQRRRGLRCAVRP